MPIKNWISKILLIGLLSHSGAQAEDIDLFASGFSDDGVTNAIPNVLLVLDNTSNWSRQNQQWPERAICPDSDPFCDCDQPSSQCTVVDEAQGQAEVAAIKAALAAIGEELNIGVLEFTTDGNANEDGGYVRFDMQRVGVASDNEARLELYGILDDIYTNVEDPIEKRSSGTAYGNLIYDVYNYLAGDPQSKSGGGTPSGLADTDAYTTQFSRFASPLTSEDVCAQTYVIFISNPNASGPTNDDAVNSDALKALYAEVGASPAGLAGDGSGGLMMQEFTTVSGSSDADVGYTNICYDSVAECSAAVNADYTTATERENQTIEEACPLGGTCACTSSNPKKRNPDGDSCPVSGSGKNRVQSYSYFVVDTGSSDALIATGRDSVDGTDFNLDDWTRFMQDYGVAVTLPEGDSLRLPVTTYTLDVFNAQPNEEHSALMDSAAERGGGRRVEANSYDEIRDALTRIFDDIVAVNTSFAAVTLPLSATNRAQQENKVFVGMFRPAKERKPRWLGNLKQYQLALFDGEVELSDAKLYRAINPETGFATSCAVSFWTEDTTEVPKSSDTTGPYFEGLGIDPPPVGECSRPSMSGYSGLSDYPDGPFVEKGGVAQQVRGQVADSGASTRDIYVVSASGVAELSASDDVESYLIGENPGLVGGDCVRQGTAGECYTQADGTAEPAEVMPYQGLRPTSHGDVIHSRPLTITYGTTTVDSRQVTNFRIFYGANDGLFRAVNPLEGTEDWAVVAEEHVSEIERLYRNTATIDYEGLPDSLSSDAPPVGVAAQKKDYFFDGSTGAYLKYNSDNLLETAYLYPTMRRGGGRIYALDVSPTVTAGVPPISPRLKWAADFDRVSQAWSTPIAGYIKSEGASNPVIAFGGGWDDCLDDPAGGALSGCTSGNVIHVAEAETGDPLASFTTDAPVVADVTPLDLDADGYWDYLYALDAAGNLYRVDFGVLESLTSDTVTMLATNSWKVTKIAKVGTSDSSIRTMNKPIVAPYQKQVFVTFGTGDRERPLKVNYPYASSVQNYFFAFVDRPWQTTERGLVNLLGGDMFNVESSSLAEGQTIAAFDGWYYEIPDRGEQVVNQSAVAGPYVFFNTFQPEGGRSGICSNLGTAKAYTAPLFVPDAPEVDNIDGGGIPIPPIIATVDLSATTAECTGDCGDGVIDDSVVTVCIGCKGFDPIEIEANPGSQILPTYQAEKLDMQ